MLPVKEHNHMLCKQYLFNSKNKENHPNNIPNYIKPLREVKHNFRTKFGEDEPSTSSHPYNTRSRQKAKLHKEEITNINDIHTQCVKEYTQKSNPNKIIDCHPPDINDEEKLLPRETRSVLAQLRSGYSSFLHEYKHRINKEIPNKCPNCRGTPHNTKHLFNCKKFPTTLTVKDLWNNPIKTAKFLNLPDNEN
jgi:hypothetical protein